jgi:hypothetical protein
MLGLSADRRRSARPWHLRIGDLGADNPHRHGLPPAPRRNELAWRDFLRQHAATTLACAFFAVETAWLKRIYVLFFLSLESRRIELVDCAPNPTGGWVTQQARNPVGCRNSIVHAAAAIVMLRRSSCCGGKLVFVDEAAEQVVSPHLKIRWLRAGLDR